MNQGIYLALDGLTGAIISVMVVANTNLGHATTMGVSLLVNHLIGFTLVSTILFFGRNNPAIAGPKQRAPWPLYLNG
ncbi:MAG TPA: DMT family transporter, partial [Sphaerochaeta sp.]|nr:DMT family transporter [Sphaerochaeta sp.]